MIIAAVTRWLNPAANELSPGVTGSWSALRWVLLAAFVVRAAVALSTDSLAHPDEVYQYLEQGHRLAFGHGWIPWEYVYGARSWIIAGGVAIILKPFDLLGLDSPYLYQPVVELVLCAISLVLPYAMYRIAQALFSERVARIALLFGAFWYELVSFAHKPLPDALSTYAFFAALMFVVRPAGARERAWAGGLAALTILLRFQLMPIVGLIGLIGLLNWREKCWPALLAFAAVMVAGGALDAYTWGVWFASITVNFEMNIVEDISTDIGSEPGHYYLHILSIASCGLWLFGVVGLGLGWRRSWVLAAIAVVHVAAFSLIALKVVRFVFPVVPIWLIGVAVLAADEKVRQGLSILKSRYVVPGALAVVALVSVGGIAHLLPGRWDIGMHPPIARSDSRAAYRHLSTLADVTGVLDNVNDTPFAIGGYYDFHVDAPMYWPPPWARGGDEVRSNPATYASHVLERPDRPGPQGYARMAHFGDVVVWRRDIDPAADAVPTDYDHLMRSSVNDLPVKVKPRW